MAYVRNSELTPEAIVVRRKRAATRQATYRKRHPRRVAAMWYRNSLKRLYGLSVEEREVMKVAQGNRCAVCGEIPEPLQAGDGFVVDHNHTTKQNRSLLCRCCNLMIGYARENGEILQQGIEYLQKWEARQNVGH
jgi:hypothetical protein